METPALKHLMCAYLHQDYDQSGTVDDNIDVFTVGTPDLAPLLPREVAEVLTTIPTDDALESYLDSLGCEILPPKEFASYREWLVHIAQRVEANLARSAE